uniref:Reverse transcriptase zinc-binding domain-containing protein n=1 Tax=Cannabis sativa TaxID=3483 RepID=A0A803NSA0_CANSA
MDVKWTNIWNDPWIFNDQDYYPKPSSTRLENLEKVADLLLDKGDYIPRLHFLYGKSLVDKVVIDGFGLRSRVNKLWNSKVLEHHKILWWNILSNALPVRALLAKRMHIEKVTCPICGEGEESMEYIFLYYNFAYHLWRSSPWGIMPILDSGAWVRDWVTFLWNLKIRGVDTIWRARNDKIILFDPFLSLSKVFSMVAQQEHQRCFGNTSIIVVASAKRNLNQEKLTRKADRRNKTKRVKSL